MKTKRDQHWAPWMAPSPDFDDRLGASIPYHESRINHGVMASSTPTITPEDQAPPTPQPSSARDTWWHEWLAPSVVSAVITALLIALISIGVAGFQSVKGDIRDTEIRLNQQIAAVKMDIVASEARLNQQVDVVKADIVASEARQRADMKDLKAELKADMKDLKVELKADNRALSNKLDRLLEALPAVRS